MFSVSVPKAVKPEKAAKEIKNEPAKDTTKGEPKSELKPGSSKSQVEVEITPGRKSVKRQLDKEEAVEEGMYLLKYITKIFVSG